MDNEGLLAWGEYEVERARGVLERAIAHTGELREIVRLENAAKRELVEFQTFLKTLGVDMQKAEREETVWAERDEEEQKELVKAHLKKLGVPAIVYKMAGSLEELLVMVSDKKAFLKRNGYSEEELEP